VVPAAFWSSQRMSAMPGQERRRAENQRRRFKSARRNGKQLLRDFLLLFSIARKWFP